MADTKFYATRISRWLIIGHRLVLTQRSTNNLSGMDLRFKLVCTTYTIQAAVICIFTRLKEPDTTIENYNRPTAKLY